MCRDCGNLVSVCSDPDIEWHPRTTVCYVSASRTWGRRVLDKKYETTKPAATALHPLDGVGVWASEIAPPADEDEFVNPVGEPGAIVLRLDG